MKTFDTAGLRAWLLSWRLLLLLFVASLLLWGGSRLYVQRRDRMLFAAAERAMDAHDAASAWFWLQRLYSAQPDNIETVRLIARFEATQRSPEELAWRVRAIRMGPATLDDYLGWASAALRLNQAAVALEALNHVPAEWRKSADYHELLAGAFTADGQIGAAEQNFAEAVQLEPTNPMHLANLATLRLAASDENVRQDARATLERIAATSLAPLPAIRGLLGDALRQHDSARMVRFRAAMLGQPARTLDDDLSCVSAAPTADDARTEMAAVWKAVEIDPVESLEMAEWMIRRGDSKQALDWLRQLPASDQSNVGIQTGEADALTALRDWAGLRSYIDGKDWRACDFLRIALLVRCARETGATGPGWHEAVAACQGDGSNLLLLAQCAAAWSWQPEEEALYWDIAQLGFPARGPALKGLWNFYTAAGNTAGLLRVAHEQYNDAPADVAASNNFAFLSLLTGFGRADADRIAETNYTNQTENANVAATYAYSLYLNGRVNDGLRILDRFGPHRLQAAGAALYLALLQHAAGDDNGAGHTAAAVDSTKLLPEERVLLQTIESKSSGMITRHGNDGI